RQRARGGAPAHRPRDLPVDQLPAVGDPPGTARCAPGRHGRPVRLRAVGGHGRVPVRLCRRDGDAGVGDPVAGGPRGDARRGRLGLLLRRRPARVLRGAPARDRRGRLAAAAVRGPAGHPRPGRPHRLGPRGPGLPRGEDGRRRGRRYGRPGRGGTDHGHRRTHRTGALRAGPGPSRRGPRLPLLRRRRRLRRGRAQGPRATPRRRPLRRGGGGTGVSGQVQVAARYGVGTVPGTGVADGDGTRGPAVPGRPVDGAGASGPTVVGCAVGRVTAGSGDGGVVGGGVGEVLLTGGGARGTVGEAG